jgi:hypothetical protein
VHLERFYDTATSISGDGTRISQAWVVLGTFAATPGTADADVLRMEAMMEAMMKGPILPADGTSQLEIGAEHMANSLTWLNLTSW